MFGRKLGKTSAARLTSAKYQKNRDPDNARDLRKPLHPGSIRKDLVHAKFN
jgi:hypothetical protein